MLGLLTLSGCKTRGVRGLQKCGLLKTTYPSLSGQTGCVGVSEA